MSEAAKTAEKSKKNDPAKVEDEKTELVNNFDIILY